MREREVPTLIGYLRRMAIPSSNRVSDRELIEAYAQDRDESAFEQIVHRHGSAVWNVCRLSAPDEDIAQDIFQATFLVLARRASNIPWQTSIANWLYETSRRIARDARKSQQRRDKFHEDLARVRGHESSNEGNQPHELVAALYEELDRLPRRLREPMLLCHLQGKTRDEACQMLNVPLGTLKHRLSQAKRILHEQLVRRGWTLSAALLTTSVAQAGAQHVWATNHLLEGAMLSASHVAWGTTSNVLTPTVVTLAEGATSTMLRKTMMSAAAVVFSFVVGICGVVWARTPQPPEPSTPSDSVFLIDVRRTDQVALARPGWLVFRGNAEQTGVVDAPMPDKLEVLWKIETAREIEGTPVVVGQTVYFGAADEHLYAADLRTGKVKWKYRAGEFQASPAWHNGRIYIGDQDGVFHCVSARDGTKLWTFETEGEIHGGANFTGTNVLFGSYDEMLYCLDPNGNLVWKVKTKGMVHGSLAVAENRVLFAGCDEHLYVLDATSGKVVIKVKLSGHVGASVAVVGDRAYVGTVQEALHSVDWKQGKVVWNVQSNKQGLGYYSSPAVTQNSVIVGCRDKKVWSIDRATGKVRWSFVTGGRVDSSPVVADQRVYVGSFDNKLYVLDEPTGRLLQAIPLDDEVLGSPALADGKVLVGTMNGTLYCLGTRR